MTTEIEATVVRDADTLLIKHLHANGRWPLALLLHGAWAGPWMFENWMSRVYAAGYDVCAINLHQLSDNLSDLNMERYIQGVRDVIACHISKPSLLIGHSMGGLIAAALAHEGLASKVALVSPVPPWGLLSCWPTKPVRQLVRRFSKKYFLRAVIRGDPFRIPLNDALALGLDAFPDPEELHKRMSPESGRAVRDMILGSIKVPDLKCPGIVVSGLEDRLMPPEIHEKVARHFRIQTHKHSSVGHLMMLEDGIVKSGGKEMKKWEVPINDILQWAN